MLEIIQRPINLIIDSRTSEGVIQKIVVSNFNRNGQFSNLIRGSADPIASY